MTNNVLKCIAPLLHAQVLSKTMDSTSLTPEKVELATISKDAETGEVIFNGVTPKIIS